MTIERQQRRVVTRGFVWGPSTKPGRELLARLREIDECQRRAWASARNYVIYR